MTYSQLLPYMIQSLLVELKSLKALPQAFPSRYDPNVKYEYHVDSIRHSTEDCKPFKAKVQQLIEKKYIAFSKGNLVVNVNLPPK